MSRIGLTVVTVALVACGCAQHHDLFVVNARIWTNDPANPLADSLHVCDGVFFGVGRDLPHDCPQAANLAFAGKTVIDAKGARIIPGLIDSHMHLFSGGLQAGRLNLRDVPDRLAFIDAVSARAAALPKGAWILGGRWSTESWHLPAQPTKHWIDPVTSNHPVLLDRMDGHGALANSLALRIAGIDEHGPADPPGGVIERDPQTHEPTGILKDSAIDLVERHIPAPTDAELDAALTAAMVEAHRHGITAVHTMSPWSELAVIDQARASGRLTLRVRYYVSESDWRQYLGPAKSHRDDDFIRVCGFKQFADGSMGSRTAYMAAPYADNPVEMRDWRGLLREVMTKPGALGKMIEAARLAGYGAAIHAIGDQANHEVLDVYARVGARFGSQPLGAATDAQSRAGRASARLRIEHAQHLLPADIARFGRLGVVASMQPLHRADDARYVEAAIGSDRCQTSYAFRSLLDADAALAFGSDWPVVSLNPFLGIHAAVTGLSLDGKAFVPAQNITVEEALRAYTSGAAYAAGDEARLGAIKSGYLADFVILEDDVLGLPADVLKTVEVKATYVGGKAVWSR